MTKLADGAVEIVRVPMKDNKSGIRIIFNKNVEIRQISRVKRSGSHTQKVRGWK